MGRIFGTDGARGIANKELTVDLALSIGRAAAVVLTNEDVKHPTFLIGKDTRVSGDMLEGALVAGLTSVGANVIILGVVPTPAVAYLVKKFNADAGIMISASHNPFEFNGIKLFNEEGFKLPDEIEEKIEDIILDKEHTPDLSLVRLAITRMQLICILNILSQQLKVTFQVLKLLLTVQTVLPQLLQRSYLLA